MQNKRGLSTVVTTILFVLIGIVAVITIWTVINNTILDEARKISLDSLTLDLKIESAHVDPKNIFATVKVVRNAGEGELKSIKFIIEDNENAEVYEELLEENELQELGKKTFHINLQNSFLTLSEIRKISIAPVYYTGGSGDLASSKTSPIMDSVEGELTGDYDIVQGEDEIGPGGQYCESVNDCLADQWEGISTCNENGDIVQKRRTATCPLENCIYTYSLELKTDCTEGWTCYDSPEGAECQETQTPCTPENVTIDCGEDEEYGPLMCRTNPEGLLIGFIDYTCEASTDCDTGYCCSSTTSTVNKEDCTEGYVCNDGECFKPLECTNTLECWENQEFGPGYICEDGNCTKETPIVSGVVNSAWPNNIGEYFDSYDLPKEDGIVQSSNYVIFNFSSDETPQTGCLQIVDFNYFENSIPYVRLNQSKTNITKDDHFQIWETKYACNVSKTF